MTFTFLYVSLALCLFMTIWIIVSNRVMARRATQATQEWAERMRENGRLPPE